MIDKRILLVGNTGSFLNNTIANGLRDERFLVHQADYSVNDVSELAGDVSAFLLFLEAGNDLNTAKVVQFLLDYCSDHQKTIFLVGDAVDIAREEEILGGDLVRAHFSRPINPKKVCSRITELFDSTTLENKKVILVVDDSGPFLLNIKKWLEPRYKVVMVNSAVNGLTYLGKNQPDLVLLDYEMPVCSGPQMLEMMRASEELARLPVFFLTGKGDRESIGKVLALKPQGYLLKSLPKDKILDAIDSFFAKK